MPEPSWKDIMAQVRSVDDWIEVVRAHCRTDPEAAKSTAVAVMEAMNAKSADNMTCMIGVSTAMARLIVTSPDPELSLISIQTMLEEMVEMSLRRMMLEEAPVAGHG